MTISNESKTRSINISNLAPHSFRWAKNIKGQTSLFAADGTDLLNLKSTIESDLKKFTYQDACAMLAPIILSIALRYFYINDLNLLVYIVGSIIFWFFIFVVFTTDSEENEAYRKDLIILDKLINKFCIENKSSLEKFLNESNIVSLKEKLNYDKKLLEITTTSISDIDGISKKPIEIER